jgi:hypothetical protein
MMHSATFARRGYLCDGYAAALLLAQASSTTLTPSTTSEPSTGNTATVPIAVAAGISPQHIIYITASKTHLLQQWDALELQQQQQQQQSSTSTTTTTTAAAAAAAAHTAAQLQQQQLRRAAYAHSLDQYFEKEGLVYNADNDDTSDTILQSIDGSSAVATGDGADNSLSLKSSNRVPSTAAVLSTKLKAQLIEVSAMHGDAATLPDIIEKHLTSGTSTKAYDTVLNMTNSSLVYEYVTQMMMYNIDSTSLNNPFASSPNANGATSKSTPDEERQVSLLLDHYIYDTTRPLLLQSS